MSDAFALVEKPSLGTILERSLPIIKAAAGQLMVGGLALATAYWLIGFLSAGFGVVLLPLIGTPMLIGMLAVSYQAARGEEVKWESLADGFKMPQAYLLGVMAMAAIFLGLWVMVIPGLYLMFALVYAKCFMLRGKSASESFAASVKLFNGNLGISLVVAIFGAVISALGNSVWVLAALTTPLMIVLQMVTFELLMKLPDNKQLA